MEEFKYIEKELTILDLNKWHTQTSPPCSSENCITMRNIVIILSPVTTDTKNLKYHAGEKWTELKEM